MARWSQQNSIIRKKPRWDSVLTKSDSFWTLDMPRGYIHLKRIKELVTIGNGSSSISLLRCGNPQIGISRKALTRQWSTAIVHLALRVVFIIIIHHFLPNILFYSWITIFLYICFIILRLFYYYHSLVQHNFLFYVVCHNPFKVEVLRSLNSTLHQNKTPSKRTEMYAFQIMTTTLSHNCAMFCTVNLLWNSYLHLQMGTASVELLLTS